MAEATNSIATTKASCSPLIVAMLQATPEGINPATRLYYELYLNYTFGHLDIGQLLLQRDTMTTKLEQGKADREEALAMLKKLRALPSRSSRYVPL